MRHKLENVADFLLKYDATINYKGLHFTYCMESPSMKPASKKLSEECWRNLAKRVIESKE